MEALFPSNATNNVTLPKVLTFFFSSRVFVSIQEVASKLMDLKALLQRSRFLVGKIEVEFACGFEVDQLFNHFTNMMVLFYKSNLETVGSCLAFTTCRKDYFNL